MDPDSIHRLRDAADPLVASHGATIIDLVIRGEQGHPVVEFFVDSETGVTLDQCSEISRTLADAIEAGNLVKGTYRIDVSSPGLNRPLRHPWQYRKHVGRKLQVRFHQGSETATRMYTLTATDEIGVSLETADHKERLHLAFGDILEATVIPPW